MFKELFSQVSVYMWTKGCGGCKPLKNTCYLTISYNTEVTFEIT